MKVSIFTPTHNVEHLQRLARSLTQQTFQEFEWVVLPNGSVKPEDVESELNAYFELETQVLPYSEDIKIGALKKQACVQCKGEILVEVDHDDELTPDALEEIVKAFEDPAIDFVYSNTVRINADGTGNTFSNDFGWQIRSSAYGLETVAFPPSPAGFSKIWYAPDHIRAWRQSFYDKIGGHDVDLAVLDDHDLLCRTYINGIVKHIDLPLYIYHLHDNNTCYGGVNSFIQDETLNIHDKYIYPMVEKWCDLNALRKIDLCGGHNPPVGYESVDLVNGDITFNLDNRDWPFVAGSVGLIRAHDALEHLKDPINTMKEVYRILAPGGWLLSLTPSAEGRGAFQDPTHVSFWNSNSFWYYTKQAQNSYINCPVRFQLNRIKNFYPSDWHKMHLISYIKADLVKLNDNYRPPGLVEI